ncbi:MAG: hypothetical protein KDC52_15315 [Ignavibacteriae bacterium]|nr:hypothetical protein [Ignavibacteriota bacterium]
MREDKILRWLIESRNKIVKQGDLETKSVANVSVIQNWYKPPINEISVNPTLDSNEIAVIVCESLDRDKIGKNSILKIERRWIENNLANYEILEALVYCFDFYAKIIFDAHNYLTNNKPNKCSYLSNFESEIKNIKNDFTLNKDNFLTTYLDINTLEQLNPKNFKIGLREKDFNNFEDNYDFLNEINFKRDKNSNLKEQADFYFEFAKKILSVDGFHIPTVILGKKDASPKFLQLKLDGKRDTYLTIHKIAQIIEVENYESIIFIGEMWVAIPDDDKPELLPGEYTNKMEALMICALNKDKEEYIYTNIFERKNDEIVYGPKQIPQNNTANFLNPIKDVWAK